MKTLNDNMAELPVVRRQKTEARAAELVAEQMSLRACFLAMKCELLKWFRASHTPPK